jgi:hypothetical protein
MDDPEYTFSNINKKIPAEDLQFLSVFDLHLTSRFTFDLKETSIPALIARTGTGAVANAGPNVPKSPRGSPADAIKKSSTAYSLNELEMYRKALFDRLNDSVGSRIVLSSFCCADNRKLVDLGAKYRILFSEKCSPSLVGSFIYVWHPDALDTIDSYFGTASRFSENREVTMWTTSITISQ